MKEYLEQFGPVSDDNGAGMGDGFILGKRGEGSLYIFPFKVGDELVWCSGVYGKNSNTCEVVGFVPDLVEHVEAYLKVKEGR